MLPKEVQDVLRKSRRITNELAAALEAGPGTPAWKKIEEPNVRLFMR